MSRLGDSENFQKMMENHFSSLRSETHTDIVLVCPQKDESVKVSVFSAICISGSAFLKIFTLRMNERKAYPLSS